MNLIEAISQPQVHLDTEQQTIVDDLEGQRIIFASPGTGKTRMLVSGIYHLVETKKINPNRILMIAFSNNAIDVLKKRIHYPVAIQTVHSLCYQILVNEMQTFRPEFYHTHGRYRLSVCKPFKQKIILSKLLREDISLADMLLAIGKAKNQLSFDTTGGFTCGDFEKDKIIRGYEREKSNQKMLDFSDMLLYTTHLFEERHDTHQWYQNQYDYVFVDESQDISPLAHKVIRYFVRENLCMACDVKQAIYGWAGVDVGYLREIERMYPDIKRAYVARNYRSKQPLIGLANTIMWDMNLEDPPMIGHTEQHGTLEYTGHFESMEAEAKSIVDWIELRNKDEVMILYRVNWYSLFIELVLRMKDIPYIIRGGRSFFKQPEILDMLAYIRLARDINDKESIIQIADRPYRGLGYKEWQRQFIDNIHTMDTENALCSDYRMKKPRAYYHVKRAAADLLDHLKVLQLLSSPFEVIQYVREYMDYDTWLCSEKQVAETGNLDLLRGLDMFRMFVQDRTFEDLNQLQLDVPHTEGVILSTIHKAKGSEAEWVHIAGLTHGIFPHALAEDSDEELRLFYVACTRAQTTLTMSSASTLSYTKPSAYTQYLKGHQT